MCMATTRVTSGTSLRSANQSRSGPRSTYGKGDYDRISHLSSICRTGVHEVMSRIPFCHMYIISPSLEKVEK